MSFGFLHLLSILTDPVTKNHPFSAHLRIQTVQNTICDFVMEKRVLTLELVVKKHGKRLKRVERSIIQLTESINDLRIEMIKGQADTKAELRKLIENKFNWILTSICAVLLTTVGLLSKLIFDLYTRL